MTKSVDAQNMDAQKDWVRRPLTWFLWWGLPIALGIAGGSFGLTYRQAALIWAVALAWMAVGCLLNAWRCHRLHCYFSGPALLVAAIAAGLVSSGVLASNPNTLNYIVFGALGATMLSFAPERIWRRYA